MPRTILDESHVHPTIRAKIESNHAEIVRKVKTAIAANDVVVVGMAQNPHPKTARRVLDAASRLRPRASGDEYDRTGDLKSPKRKPPNCPGVKDRTMNTGASGRATSDLPSHYS